MHLPLGLPMRVVCLDTVPAGTSPTLPPPSPLAPFLQTPTAGNTLLEEIRISIGSRVRIGSYSL